MKTRNGFVSNSSSASFIVDVTNLDLDKLDKLFFPEVFADPEKYDISCIDGWTVIEKSDAVYLFYTYMDNFDYIEYARSFDIPIESINGDNW